MKTLYRAIEQYENCSLTALYFENKKISYKLLLKRIRCAVSYLKSKGISRDSTVTMALPNIPQTVYLFYALDAIGAKINIIHPLSSPSQIFEAMEKTRSEHAILLETLWGEHKKDFTNSFLSFHFVNPAYESSFALRYAFYLKYKKLKETDKIHSADKLYRMAECKKIFDRNPSENCIYLHSGGTTGTPKIIALSDASINNLAKKAKTVLGGKTEGKSMLCVLPTFHGFGLGMGLHAPLANKAASALMMKFDSKKVVKWINQGKINLIIGVPLLYQKLLENKDFKNASLWNLTHCFVGGDNVLVYSIESFNKAMAEAGSKCMLLEGYGLTETVTVCTVNTKESCKIGSVGKPLEDISIEIRDESLNLQKAGEVGEVFVSGDTQMNAYLNDSEATDKTLIEIDGRLWVRTGDLGYLDSDGFLFLKGRKKRMFKISGINVYPAEIEKACCSCGEVYEAALEFFTEPKPHTKLFIIKSRDSKRSEDETRSELYSLLSARFLKYELPKEIIFLKEFPRTKVGKTDHNALAKGTK